MWKNKTNQQQNPKQNKTKHKLIEQNPTESPSLRIPSLGSFKL